MKIPTTLKHKPVLSVEDYERVNGEPNGDAKGLSLGLAQWNDRGRVDISAKVWRYTGEKWSRQSEELPLSRVLDLAILIAQGKRYFSETAYRYPRFYDPANPTVARIGLQGEGMTVGVCTDNPLIDQDIRLFMDALAASDEQLSERLHYLSDLLQSAGYGRQSERPGKTGE